MTQTIPITTDELAALMTASADDGDMVVVSLPSGDLDVQKSGAATVIRLAEMRRLAGRPDQ